MIEVISTLIENYESQEPTPRRSASQMLAHLIEARRVTSAEVAKKTGIAAAALSSDLARRREIGKANTRKRAAYFHLTPLHFLDLGDEPLTAKAQACCRSGKRWMKLLPNRPP
jgi:hypothetical protein